MKKHWLDKLILRDLFWFIVLPHRLKMFVAAQEPLPPEMAKVLHENLWDLYESDTPKVGDGKTAHNANSPTEGSDYAAESPLGDWLGSRNFVGGILTCAEDGGNAWRDDEGMSDCGVGICLIATVASG